ncbi:NEW3 domain-containing protein [Brevibacillus humidisoli]|uniref:COG1470 family protein n=1 Tax=Brevibacillus humidisoli TaxID=2895522 RepID=UPI001E5CAD90|nr:NEW3 domain-containing protein [Brevibacillus humidisoli]UFJ39703.1 NEW3 domain-containing protein [Brevibacillus humidisoli]
MNMRWTKHLSLVLTVVLGVMTLGIAPSYAAGGITLFTPYTSISVTPGESINYNIQLINNSSEMQETALSVQGLPEGWEYQLTSGGWSLQRMAVLPDEPQNVSLQVDVPLEIDKGTYRFQLVAEGKASLPLVVNVTEQGTFKTELTTEQPNMQGHADSSFSFQATLRNRTAEKQLYSLTAGAPQGWDVQFKVDAKSVTSVHVEPNTTKDIDIEVSPPEGVKKGSYKIPVKAATSSTSASAEFEVVITGSYDVELSTPTGLLSTDVTAGDERNVTLQVTNTGSADLRDIELSADTPVNWEVTFEPKKITKLEAGKSTEVTAKIKADGQAIAGDYVVSMTARAPEASSEAQFRVAVKTSLLWGWLGVLIILAVIGGVYYLFRTYGRR